jgi:ornithine cyclodeaminase/alanine dehydrogenase-like protein (mu-crystallin family)
MGLIFAAMSAPPLRYLSAADVRAAMPPVEERLELARRTMIALVADAELPPKLGVHPRQAESHTAAMPALLRGPAASGEQDLLGVKWVAAFAGNRSIGLPAIHATVILNDATTGMPLAILDGSPITAERTAALSGVALREWWPDVPRPATVALVGAGVQGASHLEVLAHVAAGSAVTIVDRNADRAEELTARAWATDRFVAVAANTDLEAAVAGADVVVTMVSFGPRRQLIAPAAFERARLIVAVDYDMCVPAGVVARSSRFLVDDLAQFEATRSDTVLRDYPRPDASIGQALTGAAPGPRTAGPVVVTHLGVGLADVVFADAVVRRAAQMGLGTELAR